MRELIGAVYDPEGDPVGAKIALPAPHHVDHVTGLGWIEWSADASARAWFTFMARLTEHVARHIERQLAYRGLTLDRSTIVWHLEAEDAHA